VCRVIYSWLNSTGLKVVFAADSELAPCCRKGGDQSWLIDLSRPQGGRVMPMQDLKEISSALKEAPRIILPVSPYLLEEITFPCGP
jgi:hypothetical protein